jgi:ETC complex I subunit conserved region
VAANGICNPLAYGSAARLEGSLMTARIYKPARTAMQSGAAKTKEWVLDYEPEQPLAVEPLMGWTSSGDMKQQLRLQFDTKEEAVAYCERNGIAYEVFESPPVLRQRISYSDNFAYGRRTPWTH